MRIIALAAWGLHGASHLKSNADMLDKIVLKLMVAEVRRLFSPSDAFFSFAKDTLTI